METIRKATTIFRQEGLAALLRRSYYYAWKLPVIDDICFHVSRRRLAERKNVEDDLDDMFATTGYISPRQNSRWGILPPLGFPRKSPQRPADPGEYSGIGAYRYIRLEQSKEVFTDLLEFVADLEPESLVEIGTFRGGSLYLWSRYLDSPERIVSIDISYDNMDRLFAEFSEEPELHFVEGNSHATRTEERVTDIVGEDGIDFLFIDGDHSYPGVKADFETYEQYVSESGVIALDDVANGNCGVPRFWRELEATYETEIIENGHSSIGIVYLGEGSAPVRSE